MRHMNFKNITIGVLMGGPSAEREVSFKTGINVCTVLRERNYAITPLMLGKDLSLSSGGIDLLFPEALKKYDIILQNLSPKYEAVEFAYKRRIKLPKIVFLHFTS